MANETYLTGWKNARLAYYENDEYVPIGCILSLSEDNTSVTRERVNVCTEGETVTTVDRIDRVVSIDGEAVDEDSYEELEDLQNAKVPVTFRGYKNDTDEKYFTGVIDSLSRTADASEDVTFSMSINVNGNFTDTDPNSGI